LLVVEENLVDFAVEDEEGDSSKERDHRSRTVNHNIKAADELVEDDVF
jgi:hypothetical protein